MLDRTEDVGAFGPSARSSLTGKRRDVVTSSTCKKSYIDVKTGTSVGLPRRPSEHLGEAGGEAYSTENVVGGLSGGSGKALWLIKHVSSKTSAKCEAKHSRQKTR